MKKLIVACCIIILSFYYINTQGSALVIPDEAIRLRVLANSNSVDDQALKTKVREDLQLYMFELLKNTKGIEQARVVLDQNLEQINQRVANTLQKNDSQMNFDINFGLNYFPQKEYKGIIYPAGQYESLLITLGEGKGDNWWCVLFPPLCLMEAEESDEVEYKSFFQELIEKYL